jgi:hypothetical protein
VTRRPTLTEFRWLVRREMDEHEWLTPSQICDRLGYGHGLTWYRVALVCERMAHEGLLELRNPNSTGKRYFRRAA